MLVPSLLNITKNEEGGGAELIELSIFEGLIEACQGEKVHVSCKRDFLLNAYYYFF